MTGRRYNRLNYHPMVYKTYLHLRRIRLCAEAQEEAVSHGQNRARTCDTLGVNQVLFQLSYPPVWHDGSPRHLGTGYQCAWGVSSPALLMMIATCRFDALVVAVTFQPQDRLSAGCGRAINRIGERDGAEHPTCAPD